jgi:signal transduction histidine kinase
MGSTLMVKLRRFRRTALAASLVATAVLIPTGAWYISGSRSARERVATMTAEAVSEVRTSIERHADRLGSRLEALRVDESARPFYHYQNLYHDPRGASQGLAVMPSPLALGPSDPLIWAHFQVDDQGRVSLPTVNEQLPELSTDQGFAMYCDFIAALQDGMLVPETSHPLSEQERVIVLARAAWEQNLLADSVYATLTGRTIDQQAPATDRPRPDDTVVIRVGPLRWHSAMIGSSMTLVALREVITPSGTMVQGFALAPEAVISWLDAETLSFTPYEYEGTGPEPSTMVSVPIGETGWHLVDDAGEAAVVAAAAAESANQSFRRLFAVGATAAIIAALAVVLMVAQTDRLARQRARFAAAAAHELKTPLSSLRLYSEMLAEGLGDPTRGRSYASRIAVEVARLGRVVSNMLDLSRLERGASLVQLTTGDLGEAITTCISRLAPALHEAGMKVTVELATELPEVSFDADAVCQILHNLLDNAEKHTRDTADRQAQVVVEAGEHGVMIAVTDNGPGIPRNQQRKLFQAFSRGDDAAAPAGLGLGLALARSLARAHGGDLTCTSHDQGATFTLTLPVSCRHPSQHRDAASCTFSK